MCALFSQNKWIFKDISELINGQHITSYSFPFPTDLFDQFRTWLICNPIEKVDRASIHIPVIDDLSIKKKPINIWSSTFQKMGLAFIRSRAVYANHSLTRLPVFIQLYHILFSFVNNAQAAIVPLSLNSISRTRKSPKNALIEGIHHYFGDWCGSEIMNLSQDTLFGIVYNLPEHNPLPKSVKEQMDSNQHDQISEFSEGFIQLYQVCRHLRIGLQMIDLKSVVEVQPSSGMQIPPLLIVFPSPWMSEKGHFFLQDYAKHGGFVWLIEPYPPLDKDERSSHQRIPLFTMITHRKIQNTDKKAHILQYYPYGMGGFLYSSHNPYRILKGFRFYLHQFLTTTIRLIQSRLLLQAKDRFALIYGLSSQLLDYLNEIDWFLPFLHQSSLKSTNLILRFLQDHRIVRKLDLSFRTEYIYRHKVDIYVFHHPKKDLLHVFLFSKQILHTLPIFLRLYLPHANSSVRIQTHLLGQTVQLLRIHNGGLTAFYYTGINPLTFIHVPLMIKVNRKILTMNHSLDIIFLSRSIGDHTEYVFYTANGTQREQIILTGLLNEPIVLPANGSVRFIQ